jgi:hypothetical protein
MMRHNLVKVARKFIGQDAEEWDDILCFNKNVYELMADFAIQYADEQTAERRTAWLIERTSVLWDHEWFCAGTDRWTKDVNKTIQFPDKDSAKEVWIRQLGLDETIEFPYADELCDSSYTISITEHVWMETERERREELEVVAAALYLGHDDAKEQFEMYQAVYLTEVKK